MNRLLTVLLFLFGALPAFAAGGSCPTPPTYLNASTNTLVTLTSLGVTSCYYASPTGVDTNTGTDEAHPWLHLPGMAGCSNNCASATLTAGEGFILQGGATYHFSGRGTPVGLPWVWTRSGTSSNPVYVGVDPTWFPSGSWTRPGMTGDNPFSTTPVGSCTHADDGETWMQVSSTTSHVIVDNLEGSGMCWTTGTGLAIFDGVSSNFNTWTNDYVHGWTRKSSCTTAGCAEGPVGFASSNGGDTGAGHPGWNNVYAQVVVDGTDSANDTFTAMEWQCFDVHNSVFNRYTNIVCAHHLAYGNIFTNTQQNSYTGGADHGNVFEENSSVENAGPNAWFNNTVAHNNNGVTVWLNPQVSSTDYVFNNVFWDIHNSGNNFNVGDPSGNIGAFVIANNTFESPENAGLIACQTTSFSYTVSIINMHFITDAGTANNCGGTQTTNRTMTHATASTQGYKNTQTFVFSPTAGTNSTVGAGTNETSICSTLTSGGNTVAGAACQSDTAYACNYNSTTHTVSCPARAAAARPSSGAWDQGAYEFVATTTWYVRSDGGTRFSSNVSSGQCDGKADAPYPGTGTNQHCAFNDIRYLWTDGTFNDGHTFPGWGWVIAGGDTMMVRDCIQYSAPTTPTPGSSGPCRIGYNGPTIATDYFLGIPGDPFDSGPPPMPSGTSGAHTRLLGYNFAACSAHASAALLNPGYGAFIGWSVAGTDYPEVQCIDLTDHTNCGHNVGNSNLCNTSTPLDDFASRGLQFSRTTTHGFINNVWAHGLADDCFSGPTGTNTVGQNFHLQGCPDSTWNMDPGDGTTGTGSLLLTDFDITASGCNEEYPIVDAMPFYVCFDDGGSSGYGDGIGTTTVASNPGWQITIKRAHGKYTTQDFLDFLHVNSVDGLSSVDIEDSDGYGIMGQVFKVGGSKPTLINNFAYGSCNAMRNALTGWPAGYNTPLSDFCRAGDETIATLLDDAYSATFQFNTVVGAQASAWNFFCFNTCAHPVVLFQNNTFLGFPNNTAHGYPGGGNGQNAAQMFIDPAVTQGTGIWLNSGSAYNHNSMFGQKETCPDTHETNVICIDPGLTDETWHNTTFGNSSPLTASPLRGAGITISGITTDINGVTRPVPPGISAFEFVGAAPAPASSNSGNFSLSGKFSLTQQ